MKRIKQEREKFTAKEAEETLVDDFERPIWIAKALEIPDAKEQLVERIAQDEEATQQIVQQAFQNEEATREVIHQAFQNEEATQQIIQQAFQHKEAKQQLGEQFAWDDEFMRSQLGDELFQLWKARQQAAGKPTEPPPPATKKNGRGKKKS